MSESVPQNVTTGVSERPGGGAVAIQPKPVMDGMKPATPEAPGAAVQASGPPSRKWIVRAIVAVIVVGVGVALFPVVRTAMNTVSTDDAYVNGHVTFVAPRVAGQVERVLVDDNMRVKRGDLLVQLDKEPYEDEVAVKKAMVASAEADLLAAHAQVRALVGQARANRYALEHSIEGVHTQVANLRVNVANLKSSRAKVELAKSNLERGEKLLPRGAITKEEFETLREAARVAEANEQQALETVSATRVSLGLPVKPTEGDDLTAVPEDLDQNFSGVRQALGQLVQSATQFGYIPSSWNFTPKQALDEFYKRDPKGDVDHIFNELIANAPAIKQAEAKLLEARRALKQSELNLKYCDVISEIDGVVTRRNVNPGNNLQAGQNVMAVRSITEIWIDANFKETQLGELRIGQRVRLEVDMYGRRREFEGRISGFTMGTGQTLALLPAQNATGNFVKIVQRLPVRIELTDYDPNTQPLFVGLSVVPYVYFKEPPTGEHAGQVLQPFAPATSAVPVGQ